MVAGLVIKLSFCGVLSLESVVLQLSEERKANESRRQLLRYVFHEIRYPNDVLSYLTIYFITLFYSNAILSYHNLALTLPYCTPHPPNPNPNLLYFYPLSILVTLTLTLTLTLSLILTLHCLVHINFPPSEYH